MSYFSTAITRIAARNQLTQTEIARHAGLTQSHISRVFNGEHRTITNEDFVKLIGAFKDMRDRAEIIAARCMDVRVGSGADQVKIIVEGPARDTGKGAKQNEFPEIELSHETERAIAYLRSQCPINPDLEKHLLGYARLMGMK